jgi:hypothetical protein
MVDEPGAPCPDAESLAEHAWQDRRFRTPARIFPANDGTPAAFAMIRLYCATHAIAFHDEDFLARTRRQLRWYAARWPAATLGDRLDTAGYDGALKRFVLCGATYADLAEAESQSVLADFHRPGPFLWHRDHPVVRARLGM